MKLAFGLIVYTAIWAACFWLDSTGRMKMPVAHWLLGSIAGSILGVSMAAAL